MSAQTAFQRGVSPLLQLLFSGREDAVLSVQPDQSLRERIEELATKNTEDALSPGVFCWNRWLADVCGPRIWGWPWSSGGSRWFPRRWRSSGTIRRKCRKCSDCLSRILRFRSRLRQSGHFIGSGEGEIAGCLGPAGGGEGGRFCPPCQCVEKVGRLASRAFFISLACGRDSHTP